MKIQKTMEQTKQVICGDSEGVYSVVVDNKKAKITRKIAQIKENSRKTLVKVCCEMLWTRLL